MERAARAQIEKFTLLIKRNRFVIGQALFDMLDFERLIQVAADFNRLAARTLDPFKRFVQLDQALHFGFDRREILLVQWTGGLHVIVKAPFDRRSKSQLDAAFQPHHRPPP